MKTTLRKQMAHTHLTLACLALALLLLTACRSMSSTIKVTSVIMPEPIVGEIVTLRIEALSTKFSGEGFIMIVPTEGMKGINIIENDLEWHGLVVSGEPFVFEVPICVTQPGYWSIYIQAGVMEKDGGQNQLHIISTADSAEVIPSSEYEVHQPPFGSTPTPTPEPVQVSPECAGV